MTSTKKYRAGMIGWIAVDDSSATNVIDTQHSEVYSTRDDCRECEWKPLPYMEWNATRFVAKDGRLFSRGIDW